MSADSKQVTGEVAMDDIPIEIINAAKTVARYFKERNIKDWKLGDCMARFPSETVRGDRVVVIRNEIPKQHQAPALESRDVETSTVLGRRHSAHAASDFMRFPESVVYAGSAVLRIQS